MANVRQFVLPALALALFLIGCNDRVAGSWIETTCPGAPEGMKCIPDGEFFQGARSDDAAASDHERPMREVYLDTFFIHETEVTVAQYSECIADGRCEIPLKSHTECNHGIEGRERHPINCVNWYEARDYCEWAGYRLPTEAEWEKAARGTDGRTYPWGEATATCERAIMEGDGADGCGKDRTWEVGSRPSGASPYGLQDMGGNVLEWVNDWFDYDYYAYAPTENPQGAAEGTQKLIKGGAWNALSTVKLRSARRLATEPETRHELRGFRCATTP